MREAESARPGTRLPGGWILQAGPFAALAAAALYLRSRWAELPERFPVHWGFDGRPNGWATRSVAGIYGPLILAAVIAASMVLLAWFRQRQARTTGYAHAPASAAELRFRRAMQWAILGTEYLLVLIAIWTSLLPLAAAAAGGTAGPPNIAPVVALILVFLVSVTIVLARIGKEARRAAASDGLANHGAGAAPSGRHAPASCWKAGIFYVNPDDPSIFVEKRFGIGYTLNFARPASWIILGLSILAPLAVAAWIAHAAS